MKTTASNETNRQPKYLWWLSGGLLALLLIGVLIRVNKMSHNQKPITPDPAFAAYVSGYTGGVISKKHPILIQLAISPMKKVKTGDPFPTDLISFTPSVKGTAHWQDGQTIVFLPDQPMKSGRVYNADLQLSKIVKVSDEKFNHFKFGFQVIPQSFEVLNTRLIATTATGADEYTFQGKVITADIADNKEVEQLVKANYLGKSLPIAWQHISPTEHTFLIKNLKRYAQSEGLKISWNGSSIDVDKKGEMEITIPKKGVFKLIQTAVEQDKKQAVHFLFSDPLNKDQNFSGLIQIDSQKDFQFAAKDNELTVFTNNITAGEKSISVLQGIQNAGFKALSKDSVFQIKFQNQKPAVRFVHQGNLLPSTDGMVLPFEAVGLKSILIRVIRINQDRIGQFLQVNDLDGSSQLNRVARPILQKVIRLDNMGVKNLNQRNRFTLELSKLIKAEPGAIYQIGLAFTPVDVLNNCGSKNRNDGLTKVSDPREKIDESSFDDANSYYSDAFGQFYDDNYDWSKRDDPCNAAYYSGDNNVIKENILATDIGLTAKRGTNNSLWIMATNLLSAEPISGVKLHIYNYQLREIATTNTGSEGIAQINLSQKPFLIEATQGKQWSYLRVDDGTALSVSQFDVSGASIQHGLKGFLYGDRGVWRPGDSLYLSFMLEDKTQQLPPNHPVIFELANPQGTVVERQVKSSSVHGLYTFKTATTADAPTGNWTATVKVGDATFAKDIRIETVKPNRLKIELNFPKDKLTPESQTGILHARWLSGATAANLTATYDMILSAVPTKIKGYKDYQFDDPLNQFQTDERTIFKGNLDVQGNATVNPAIHLQNNPPATLKAYFTGKVFEPGGNFSVNYQSVNFYPYTSYIGIKVPEGSSYGNMLELDKNYQVKVVSVDTSGSAVNKDDLEVTVYKAQWRWWWDADENDDADFVNSRYYHKVFETKIATHSGKSSFPLKIASPNWGRYYIHVEDPKTGYATGTFVYFEWPFNSGSDVAGMPGGATRLSFTTDKRSYKIGEKMKLFIPGSGVGNIFISVENGTGVLKTFRLKEKKGSNTFFIPVTKEMTPNVYLNVAEIQPHDQTVNDLPIRQYGIIGVKVEDPATYLHPVIEMPNELRPNHKVSIRVKEKDGKPMAYTIAVVDEGLLDLTNFKTPDPHNTFYAKEALGVKTWDAFDKVIGAYGANLERLLSIGGDGAVEEKPQSHNVRFKPVVKFFGPYYLGKNESKTVSFMMPNYVGEVRTMLVAANNGAYGSAEKSVPVKQPLMILSTLPRVAGPGEDIMLPVNVFVQKASVKNVSIRVMGNSYFQVVGAATKSVHFDKPGSALVMFKIHVANREGAGVIHINASGNGYTAESETDLKVRNPNPPQTRVLTKVLKQGESWSPKISFFGMTGTNSAKLEVAGIPSLNLGKRLNYLMNYPFGCSEQRVSSAFPQLYLNDLISLSEAQKKNISENVSTVIKAIPSFQHSTGGFTYWPGSNYPDDWVSSYVGNFLLEAQNKGYQILPGILNNWIHYQTNRADTWKPSKYNRDELAQSYRLYTLALAKHPDWSAMNRMYGLQKLSLQARWSLAAAYTVAGRKDVAEKLIQQMNTTVPNYREMYFTYGSSLRDEAMILQTLIQMGAENKGYDLAKTITQSLNSSEWLSTQETAFSLMALSEYYSRQKSATQVKYSYRQNSQSFISVQSDKSISQKDLNLSESHPELTIKNNANGILYVHVYVKGTPVAGNEISGSDNLEMTVHYTDMNGRSLNPNNLNQGTDFVAEVTIKNPGIRGDYKNMALTQIFPSGWEIRNTRFDGTSNIFQTSAPTYQDIRDDRVYTYFDLSAGEQKRFRILLNATYAGRFYLPSVKCDAMYDGAVNATTKGEWVTIKEDEIAKPVALSK